MTRLVVSCVPPSNSQVYNDTIECLQDVTAGTTQPMAGTCQLEVLDRLDISAYGELACR